MTQIPLAQCRLCGGTAGRFIDGAHALCTALAKEGMPTPSLGDRCPTCRGSGVTGQGGVMLSFELGPAAIAKSIAAQFPSCRTCGGSGISARAR